MSRAEVEAMLGPSVHRYGTALPPGVAEFHAYYLPPPELEPWDSPWGPGTICVDYSVDNRVRSKRLNPHWREPQHVLINMPPEPNGAPEGAGGG